MNIKIVTKFIYLRTLISILVYLPCFGSGKDELKYCSKKDKTSAPIFSAVFVLLTLSRSTQALNWDYLTVWK